MDFYESLVSPYVQVVSVPITTNLPANTKWWKVKNKDWNNLTIRREIDNQYIASVSLVNSLNTLTISDVMFKVIDSTTDRVVSFTDLYDTIISKDELINMIRQMTTELISNINDTNYQVMCIDNDNCVTTNGKVYNSFFNLKTGEYIEHNVPTPIVLKITLDL